MKESKVRTLTEKDIDLAIDVFKKYGVNANNIYYHNQEIGFTNKEHSIGPEEYFGLTIVESPNIDFNGLYIKHNIVEINNKYYTVFENDPKRK